MARQQMDQAGYNIAETDAGSRLVRIKNLLTADPGRADRVAGMLARIGAGGLADTFFGKEAGTRLAGYRGRKRLEEASGKRKKAEESRQGTSQQEVAAALAEVDASTSLSDGEKREAKRQIRKDAREQRQKAGSLVGEARVDKAVGKTYEEKAEDIALRVLRQLEDRFDSASEREKKSGDAIRKMRESFEELRKLIRKIDGDIKARKAEARKANNPVVKTALENAINEKEKVLDGIREKYYKAFTLFEKEVNRLYTARERRDVLKSKIGRWQDLIE